ncbi:cell adhesion molecule 4-like [Anneissia japonica]|uniref:cell adhesion molecule 4-like n=1 Tax=Anneissia japonica TaxID=1529436 RepID=UPI0014258181|nr:cell adhesion molecule 4-like [Anneissia japonica]
MCILITSIKELVMNVVQAILFFLAYCEAVQFLHQPMDHSAVERRRAHVTCIFKDITDYMEEKYNVIWTKDTYIISEPSNGFDLDRFSFHDHYVDSRHLLRIDPVKREDKGGYRCHLRYNGEVLLTSNIGMLTIREIPSDKYPLVKLGKPTYTMGEEVTITCLCEKTNPVARLKWASEYRQLLRPTTNSRENNTHIWIEAIVSAVPNLDGIKFVCKMIVEDETAPRYSQSEELHIIDILETTSKEPSRQTHKQQYMTRFLLPKNVPQVEMDETFAKGGTRPIAYSLGIIVTQSVCASVILVAMAT